MESNTLIYVLTIITLCLLFFLIKKKVFFLINLLVSASLLIVLSHFDFLDFKGRLDVLSIAFMIIAWTVLNLTSLICYTLKLQKTAYFTTPLILFFLITFILTEYIDKNDYYYFKLGILVRVFVSFFPIYFITYYYKYTLLNSNHNQKTPFK